MGYRQVGISFPEEVEMNDADFKELLGVTDRICKRYQETHPGRIMWPVGVGLKPTFIPMTQEEEAKRGMEFDENMFGIECSEREDYDWKCARCGKPQGDHKGMITDPPAGDCEFTVTNS